MAIIHITHYIFRKIENNITSYKNLSVHLAKYVDTKKAEKKKRQMETKNLERSSITENDNITVSEIKNYWLGFWTLKKEISVNLKTDQYE